MKKIYCILLMSGILILCLSDLTAQRQTTSSLKSGMSDYSFYGLWFINDQTGIAIGYDFTTERSLILRSEDMGMSWNPVEHPYIDNGFLIDLHFSDSLNGYAVGDFGTVLKTVDGGQTWTQKSVGNKYYCGAVFGLDPDTAWISQVHGQILRSTNGFNTNSIFFTGLNTYPRDIFFIDSDTGFAVLGWCANCELGIDEPDTGGYLLRTNDRGDNWVVIQKDTAIWGYRNIYFVNDRIGYISGTQGTLYRSDDAGMNWVKLETGTEKDLWGITFVNTDVGFVVGGTDNGSAGIILKTTDGGETWTEKEFPHDGRGLYSVFFMDENMGWIAGNQILLHTTDGGETWIPLGINDRRTMEPLAKFYPNPADGILTVEVENTSGYDTRIELLSVTGQLLYSKGYNKRVLQITELINLSGYAEGVYLVKVRQGGATFVDKVIVR